MFFDILHRPGYIQKHHPLYFLKHNVSETESSLRNVVFGKYKQDGILDKDKIMNNVQKHHVFTNVPSS
jgi:hypothetical protein